MAFFPLGPNSVFYPRRATFRRLSRRNEWGQQGLVSCIAIEPSDPNTIYVVVRPSTGGASLFRTRDGGNTWDPIGDWLRAVRTTADPVWIAIHPVMPGTIYVASWGDSSIYISNNRGDAGTWGPANALGARPLQLIVDPRNATALATTVIYARGWQSGVHRSPDGGTTWPRVLNADPTWMVAHMPASGTAHFYVGSWAQGLWHSTNPTAQANWQNLSTLGIGLPQFDSTTAEGNYTNVLVDLCRRTPDRVYAWFMRDNTTTGLYTTSASTTSWTRITSATMPNPHYNLYTKVFAVAPNSPGDGTTDTLFFGNTWVQRSIDAGQNWVQDGVSFHADIHSFAFDPPSPAAGVVPAMYLGCDGGLARSVKAADRTVPFTAVTDYNEGATYDANLAGWANLNHGKASTAVICYACDPAAPAVSYIGCQDTGIANAERTLGWRGVTNADVYTIAAVRGSTSMSVWVNYGDFSYLGWPGFRVTRFADSRDSAPWSWARLGGAAGVVMANTSNFAIGVDGKLVSGVVVRDSDRTIAAAITAGTRTVTPSSMTGIRVGTVVIIEPGVANQEERLLVSGVAATTFTATFAMSHPPASAVRLERAFVMRVGNDDIGAQISQDFGDAGHVVMVAMAHPTNANNLYCAIDDSNDTEVRAGREERTASRVFTTTSGSTASSSTVWTEIATNRPTPGATPITWMCVDSAGTVYVMWRRPIVDAGGTVTTPLYRLAGGSWNAEATTGVPAGSLGKLLADPVRADVLYVNVGNTVYQLAKSGGTWTWTDLGAGLPGAPVYDIWVGNLGTTAAPRVLLRAAVTTRGVFEAEVTAGASDPTRLLYVRDHILDTPLLPRSADGVQDPYKPGDPNAIYFHYMSPDVKVDVRAGGIVQTQSEGAPPLTNMVFDMLVDKSQNLTSTGQGLVHVQVHNRSRTAVSGVKVWAIFCRAAGGVPALSRSASMGDAFPFWNQFTSGGDIVPNLPGDSPWSRVDTTTLPNGVATLDNIDVDHPRVATFTWTIPTLTAGDTGHYCLAVFVHSASSPIGETTDMSVDSIAQRNRQLGQKNVHVVAAGAGGAPAGSSGESPGGAPFEAREYIEFHNPTRLPRIASLRFDLRSLPPDVVGSLRFTAMKTSAPLDQSLSGVARSRKLLPGEEKLTRARREAGVIAGKLRDVLRAPAGERLPALKELARERLRSLLRCLLGDSEQHPAHRLPRFEAVVHEVQPSSEVVVRDVELPPFGQVGALMELRAAHPPQGERRVHVQQVMGKQVVGGSVYIMGMPEKQPPQPEIPSEHDPESKVDPAERRRKEEESKQWRYVPPWIRPQVDEREVEVGKKPPPDRKPRDDDDHDHGQPPPTKVR